MVQDRVILTSLRLIGRRVRSIEWYHFQYLE